jgi:two-component system, cell cycle response regulator
MISPRMPEQGPGKKRTLEFRTTAAPYEGRKLLIADDDARNIAFIREGLSNLGCRILEAKDGASALTVVKESRPDLVLMDVQMPGLGGVEVCRIIKANQTEAGFGFIPVILMTARQGSGQKVESLELGADDYLVKPVHMAELSARVKSMLRLKGLQDALVEKNRELDKVVQELDQKRQELLALSRTDALTGLFNRRYFEERLSREFARSSRYRSPLSCLMLDIDHFKRVNDTYGHPFGDRVIQVVAAMALKTLRDVDLLARYGGEEFVALLPETGPQDAWRAAERVRRAIETAQWQADTPQGKAEVRVTVSLGVATYPVPHIDSTEALLRAADDALYRAKQAGRNQVKQQEE